MFDEPAPIGSSMIKDIGGTAGSQHLGESLQPERSAGHGPINSHHHLSHLAREQPFTDCESDYTDEPSSPPQLRPCLKLLFSLQGAVMQLPSLALMAIVNDRVAILPSYLPAYSAVCFLPHCLKPLWAILSTLGAGSTSEERHIPMLMAILQAANGLTYLGTALWIPVEGVYECYVWGFLRGVTHAWCQFLMDQLLIQQAQSDSSHSNCYEAVSSIFQSHAATYSSGGSLVASIASFAIFAWRQVHQHGDGTESPVSPAVVFALLIGSAVTCFVGAAAMIHQLQISKWAPIHSDESRIDDEHASNPNGQQGQQQPKRAAGPFAPGSLMSSKYDSHAPGNDGRQECEPLLSSESLASTSDPSSSIHPSLDTSQECRPHRGQAQTTIRDKIDVACLVLLQTLLVGGAVKHSVDSLGRGAPVWTAAVIILATSFIVMFLVSSCWIEYSRYEDGNVPMEAAPRRNASAAIPARRLGLYLMLRHSVPNADFLMYSYIYAVFGKDEPVFIQGLAIFESSASWFASWVYGRYLAVRFHSGWGVVGLIATLTILTSLVSLLDITIVHATFGKEAVAPSQRWIVLSVGVVTSFMGQIGYMPSVVLATANVVTSTGANGAIGTRRGVSDSLCGHMTPRYDTGNRYVDAEHNEGIQYATSVACIDFGAQVGDWISVPIIAALAITRENQWTNLDKLIILCAEMRIASLAFLFIIWPYSASASTITTPNESHDVSHVPDGLGAAPPSLESSKDSIERD